VRPTPIGRRSGRVGASVLNSPGTRAGSAVRPARSKGFQTEPSSGAGRTAGREDSTDAMGLGFSSAQTDVVTQVRFLRPDGTWNPWTPRNLLAGGEFPDTNHDGIPDWTWVFQLRSDANAIFADWALADPLPLLPGWRKSSHRLDLPPRGVLWMRRRRRPARCIPYAWGVTPRTARTPPKCGGISCPPGTALTVSGDRYDIAGRSMGVTARFHEFDSKGERLNKFVLLGDDDFPQPADSSPWRWRALSLTTLPTTLRLGIYPIRMIRAQGALGRRTGRYVRARSTPKEGGQIVFADDFSRPAASDFNRVIDVRVHPQYSTRTCAGNRGTTLRLTLGRSREISRRRGSPARSFTPASVMPAHCQNSSFSSECMCERTWRLRSVIRVMPA
jgi:hypothetical protein